MRMLQIKKHFQLLLKSNITGFKQSILVHLYRITKKREIFANLARKKIFENCKIYFYITALLCCQNVFSKEDKDFFTCDEKSMKPQLKHEIVRNIFKVQIILDSCLVKNQVLRSGHYLKRENLPTSSPMKFLLFAQLIFCREIFCLRHVHCTVLNSKVKTGIFKRKKYLNSVYKIIPKLFPLEQTAKRDFCKYSGNTW